MEAINFRSKAQEALFQWGVTLPLVILLYIVVEVIRSNFLLESSQVNLEKKALELLVVSIIMNLMFLSCYFVLIFYNKSKSKNQIAWPPSKKQKKLLQRLTNEEKKILQHYIEKNSHDYLNTLQTKEKLARLLYAEILVLTTNSFNDAPDNRRCKLDIAVFEYLKERKNRKLLTLNH